MPAMTTIQRRRPQRPRRPRRHGGSFNAATVCGPSVSPLTPPRQRHQRQRPHGDRFNANATCDQSSLMLTLLLAVLAATPAAAACASPHPVGTRMLAHRGRTPPDDFCDSTIHSARATAGPYPPKKEESIGCVCTLANRHRTLLRSRLEVVPATSTLEYANGKTRRFV